MPTLETEIWNEYESRGLQAVAMSSSTIGPEDPTALADYVDTMGLTMTVLADYDVAVYGDYRIACPDGFAPYPREFLIDRDGTILYTSCTIDVDELKTVLDANL